LLQLVQDVVKEVGASTPRDKGKVMGRLMPQVRGRADGTVVNDLVTQLLESGS
ncbi:MAG: GatB/YqeY domain-containing protein, partial [Chloroflexi bacterium]|nr:GatB/YqeY domain-containing protein [Chloroflexota bacterium]